MIPQEQLDEILARTDIVSIVSEHVSLKKAGRTFKGLCPFHSEKTSSFIVSPEKGIFHCFGCGSGGNAFGFVMKIDSLTFPEAAERLAEKAGIRLNISKGKPETEASRDFRDTLYKINRYAAWYYNEELLNCDRSDIKTLLKKRGLTDELVKEFKLGLAPDKWDGLSQFLYAKKAPEQGVEALGLIRRGKTGNFYDFFRNRLMFPIVDAEGRFVGFGGRRLTDADQEEAKYINSPESPIYHKGNGFFGLFQAKKAIREKDQVILVEGYMDLIRLHSFGVQNVVAPLGTALTLNQARMLTRFTRNVVLLFDGDNAGLNATLRAVTVLFEAGLHPRIARLPDKDDPDTFIAREGTNALETLIKDALPAMDWLVVTEAKGVGSVLNDKVQAAQRLTPYFQALPSEMEKKTYQAKISEILGIPFDAPKPKGNKDKAVNQPPNRPPSRPPLSPTKNLLERNLVGLYVRYPQALSGLLGRDLFQKFKDSELKTLALAFCDLVDNQENATAEMLLSEPEWAASGLLAELILESSLYEEDPAETAKTLLLQFDLNQLKGRLNQITSEIRVAEMEGNAEKLQALLIQKNEVTRSITEARK